MRNLFAPTVIVLASGRGERFAASGGSLHKLQTLLGGKTVLQHTLDAVKASGLPWHLETSGLPGMGDSIAAGVRATTASSGWLILPGDLPLVRAQTILAVAARLKDHAVVVPHHNGQRGHPVGFAQACREALLALRGERGAGAIVQANGFVQVDVDDIGMVTDIDTVADLERARTMLEQRDKRSWSPSS